MGSAQVLEPTVEFLAGLAGQGGRALELAIGTGRVALPLSARGVEVSGIELSPDMVAQLRSKPGGSEIPVTVGEMASVRADGHFEVEYHVFKPIEHDDTQDRHAATFSTASHHLDPGGAFVIELGVVRLRRPAHGHDTVHEHTRT